MFWWPQVASYATVEARAMKIGSRSIVATIIARAKKMYMRSIYRVTMGSTILFLLLLPLVLKYFLEFLHKIFMTDCVALKYQCACSHNKTSLISSIDALY